MKINFNKALLVTKKMMKILRALLNVGFVIISMLMVMFKQQNTKYYCHMTEKYRGSAHRDRL